MAFIAAGNIILEYVISGAAVARSWTSYFATLCNHEPQDFRIIAHNLSPNYNQLDPIAVVVIAVICVLAVYSVKGSSRLNYFSSIVHLLIIVFIVIAGLFHANKTNLTNFTPYGPRGIFQASAVLFFAYVGFDAVSTMAEETKNPARDIPIGLIGSMTICTFAYCVMSFTLCLMVPYSKIDKDAPFTLAFQQVLSFFYVFWFFFIEYIMCCVLVVEDPQYVIDVDQASGCTTLYLVVEALGCVI